MAVHASDYIILGYSSTYDSGTYFRPKVLEAFSRDDKTIAIKMTFIYVPHNLATSMTFLPTGPIRSIGTVPSVVSMSAVYIYDNLIVAR